MDDLTKPEIEYIDQSKAIVYGTFYTIGCLSLFILSTTVTSIFLVYLREVRLVMYNLYAFLAATVCISVVEYAIYPYRAKDSPRLRILCVSIINKLFYLAELMMMDLRMDGKISTNYVYIPYFMHLLCLAFYLCYCYCKCERPGISIFNFLNLATMAASMNTSKNSYETLQENFDFFAISTYFVLFFYGFIIFFFIIYGCQITGKPMLFEGDSKKLEKLTEEMKKKLAY